MIASRTIRVGTAAWSIPKASADKFPAQGSHLERYATGLNAVEINSSFYRPHRLATYQRWANTVPDDFKFTVKIPKAITHELRLIDAADRVIQFLSEVEGLGSKLGALLVQLPPSLHFDEAIVSGFLENMRKRYPGMVACEPRHSTWFTSAAARTLANFQVSYVAADPAIKQVPEGMLARYYRLHGSPEMYYSPYSDEYLESVAEKLKQIASINECWCIFDNTALGHATENALRLRRLLQ